MPIKIFISYAKEDKVFARRLYNAIQQAGLKPWLDSIDLLPGQNWDTAITKAISECRYFIALLSSLSVGKKGYVQKEIRNALNIAKEYPPDEIFIIPVRIDDCEPSFEGLRMLHRADVFPDFDIGLKELLRVFEYESKEKPALIKVDIERRIGTIRTLTDRGFGFLRDEYDYFSRSAQSIFFHSVELEGISFDELREGVSVTFIKAKGPFGDIAVSVQRA